MTDFTEQARGFRLEHGYPWCGECDLDRVCSGCEPMLKTFTAALAAAYEQGLEDAARVIEADAETWDELAAKIRALKEKKREAGQVVPAAAVQDGDSERR